LKEANTIAALGEIWTPNVSFRSTHESTSSDPACVYCAGITASNNVFENTFYSKSTI